MGGGRREGGLAYFSVSQHSAVTEKSSIVEEAVSLHRSPHIVSPLITAHNRQLTGAYASVRMPWRLQKEITSAERKMGLISAQASRKWK